MSTALAKNQTWIDVVNEAMPRFNRIASQHKMVQWQAESQFAIQALQKNKYLAKSVPYTVQNAIINVAAVGLTLNPADGYAYLVPEYNKDTEQQECNLRISFKGLIKVATDSGAISWVKAEIVKENDTFEYRGISQPPEHKMNPFEDRGETVGVYCVAKTNDGEFLVDIMKKSEIDQCMACAKTQVVWNQWYDEMAKKAIIKRASKQWPRTDKSSQLHKAVEVINEIEGSDEQYMLYTPEQKETFDKLFQEKDALRFMAFVDSLEGDIYGELFKASKEEVREEKGMTQRGQEITDLFNNGRAQYRDMRENILELAESADVDAVEEQFAIAEEYGLKGMLWQSFDDEQRELFRSLKRIEDEKNRQEAMQDVAT